MLCSPRRASRHDRPACPSRRPCGLRRHRPSPRPLMTVRLPGQDSPGLSRRTRPGPPRAGLAGRPGAAPNATGRRPCRGGAGRRHHRVRVVRPLAGQRRRPASDRRSARHLRGTGRLGKGHRARPYGPHGHRTGPARLRRRDLVGAGRQRPGTPVLRPSPDGRKTACARPTGAAASTSPRFVTAGRSPPRAGQPGGSPAQGVHGQRHPDARNAPSRCKSG